jgi:uncharacterized protein
MSSPLPDLLDPWRAVDSSSVFAGRLPVSRLPRLRGLLLDAGGEVSFRLAFFRDEERWSVVRCEVAVTLRLRCQRCLEALDRQVDASALLALVSGSEKECLIPESYDPLLAGGEVIRPRDLIEDELLLALPQVPMHEQDACGVSVWEADSARVRPNRASPFRVLAELKRKS